MMHGFAFIPSTDLSPLVESAFRGLLLAALVAGGLKLLRVRNVVAQKMAWLLVLACAFAMPLITPLALRIPISANDVFHLSLKRTQTIAPSAASVSVSQGASIVPSIQPENSPAEISDSLPLAPPAGTEPARAITPAPRQDLQSAPESVNAMPTRLQFLFLLYAGVCATLLFRLIRGIFLARRLWHTAEPVEAALVAPFVRKVPVRSSTRIASPLNVASGILLPADFAQWDKEKLAIVLAHEASHVRQRDFYLQLAAQLYAAVFWFSPLGWWMGRKLSDLSEAISDHVGLSKAKTPASYAQVLLEFAALARPTLIGVAMARPGRLTQRIERLLNESRFRESFAATRVRICAALVLVPAALFAATSLVRVQAAQLQATQAPAAVLPMPEAPQQPAAPTPAPTPKAPATPQISLAPAPVAVPTPAPTPSAPGQVALPPIPPVALITKVPPIPPGTVLLNGGVGNGIWLGVGENQELTPQTKSDVNVPAHANQNYGAYTHERDGEFYGFFERHGGSPHYSGSWTNGHLDVIDKAEKLAKGDFILYTNRAGKSYYIDDPQSIAQMEALYGAIRSFSTQKEAMARAQKALAEAQARMAERQKQQPISKPDLEKDLADLSAAIARLQAQKETTITPDELANLQSKLGEMQGKLIQLQISQSRLDQINSNMAAQMAKQMAKLSTLQESSQWNSDLSRDAERTMKSIIDQCLKDGRAKPVE